ncbi:benzoyl-coa reductase subunit badg [hydrocarbon metagenome]|uniref:Benzoyl-coa reductase subunit badg n=1 Tax=hydrocarbon metagenome TaxID=938273 RepID=A0A0W8FQV1_9ZZZZ
MITAGCDIGSLTAKAVILKDGKIIASEVILASAQPEKSALEVIKRAVEKAGIKIEDIEYSVGTGYGRKHIPFMNSSESEIVCHGRGAVWQVPSARTVVDIGGQDAKAIRIDEKGNVERYVYNDKCASGTGRFLEVIADALDIKLEDLGTTSERSTEKLTLSNQCVIFAETEIISLVNEGKEIPDIISALHQAVANRAASLAKSILVAPDAVMTGGVAKNSGMFSALEKALGVKMYRVENPQINGALGAALIAVDALESSGKK